MVDVLRLDAEERGVLFRGFGLHSEPSRASEEALEDLQLLLDSVAPLPAIVTDLYWDVLAYNDAWATWMPYVKRKGANSARFVLLSREGRTVCGNNWECVARQFLAGLRMCALDPHVDRDRLDALMADVLKDKDCPELWERHPEAAEVIAPRPTIFHLSATGRRPLKALMHHARPIALPQSRMAIITPLRKPSARKAPARTRQ
ncbi:MmyB family transcriptional regulator [Streptomyces sp. URMC 129]|uniref:MmyB family transcriptional regulator n=1 Tax=Streptomyces sp. URMC 129 TaxID=3423407 RepID=UPI003F1AF7C1